MGLVFGFLFSIAGGGILWITWGFSIDTIRFVQIAHETEGRIVSYDEWEGTARRTDVSEIKTKRYSPNIEYSVPGQEEKLILSSNVSSMEKEYLEGSQVSVLYDPDNPNHSLVKNYFDFFMPTVIGGVLGIVFSMLGIFFFRLQLRGE